MYFLSQHLSAEVHSNKHTRVSCICKSFTWDSCSHCGAWSYSAGVLQKDCKRKKKLLVLSATIFQRQIIVKKVKNTGSFDQMFVPKHFFTFSPLNYQETDKSTKKPVLISVTVFHGVS